MPQSLISQLFATWHPEYAGALLTIAILLFVLLRQLPEGRGILRNTLVFIGIFILLTCGSAFAAWMQMGRAGDLLDELAVITLGLLVIRLVGLALFRVLIPVVGLVPPRILEDIAIALAYIAWGLVRLRYAGLNFSGIVTTSAVITGIIAFSMQETLGNLLGGLALQLDNSVSIGDWVRIDEVSGRVIEVHWRHTAIRTRNGEVVVIPNSLLMKAKVTVVGGEDVPQWRRWVHFAVSYQVPPQRIIDIITRALGDANIAHVSREPAPQCIVMDYKDGASQYAVRYWLTNPQFDDPTDSAIRVHIYTALQRQGYTLAQPGMDVSLTTDNDERTSRLHEKELALRKKTLKGITLFAQLSDTELGELAGSLTYVQFARGDLITRQGAVAHWLYILIKGEADVWFESGGGSQATERQLLTTLPSGRVFGEMGLMTGEPRRATVTAHSDAECYRLDKTSFEGILQSRPELAEQIASILMERNQQLVAVQQQRSEPPMDHAQQKAKILSSIRRFFRLDHHD